MSSDTSRPSLTSLSHTALFHVCIHPYMIVFFILYISIYVSLLYLWLPSYVLFYLYIFILCLCRVCVCVDIYIFILCSAMFFPVHTIPYYVHILPYYASYYVYVVYVYVQTYIFSYYVLLCFPCSYNPTLCSHTHYASLLHCMCIVCNSILCSSYSFLIPCYASFVHCMCIVCNSPICSSLWSFSLYVIPQYVLHYDLSSLYVVYIMYHVMHFPTLFHCVCVPMCVCSYYVTCIFILCSILFCIVCNSTLCSSLYSSFIHFILCSIVCV